VAQKRIYELTAEASPLDSALMVAVDKSGKSEAGAATIEQIRNHSIGDLSDVTVSATPTDGSILRYDSTNSEWENSNGVYVGTNSITVGATPPQAQRFYIRDTVSYNVARFVTPYSTRVDVESDGGAVPRVWGFQVMKDTGEIRLVDVSGVASMFVVTIDGNFGFGTTAPGGSAATGDHVLSIIDATTPPSGGVSGQVGLYSTSGGLAILTGGGANHIIGDTVTLETTRAYVIGDDATLLFVESTANATGYAAFALKNDAGNVFYVNMGNSGHSIIPNRLGIYTPLSGGGYISYFDTDGIHNLKSSVFHEISSPSAPASGSVRVFARDDGTGLTEFGLQFNTGDVQILGKQGYTVPTYTTANVTTTRSLDVSTATLADVANVLGTLIADMQARGWFN